MKNREQVVRTVAGEVNAATSALARAQQWADWLPWEVQLAISSARKFADAAASDLRDPEYSGECEKEASANEIRKNFGRGRYGVRELIAARAGA